MSTTILTRGQDPVRLVNITTPTRLVTDRVTGGDIRVVDGDTTVMASRGSVSAPGTVVIESPLIVP